AASRRDHSLLLSSTGTRFFVPTCGSSWRRAQRPSRMASLAPTSPGLPPGHALTDASTASSWQAQAIRTAQNTAAI
ncbi:hypothetical protein, partial [Bradyrhizobium sp. SHOUNA76]|uniref:hypothetical protein n=1 Tax=Bradyrhizobium sp. SHOUNA76 TaxID=2908927 RepID=UPI001FF132F1